MIKSTVFDISKASHGLVRGMLVRQLIRINASQRRGEAIRFEHACTRPGTTTYEPWQRAVAEFMHKK